MNRKQCEEMLEFLKQEVEIFKKKIEEFKKLETEGHDVWKPKMDEDYWYVGYAGGVYKLVWESSDMDEKAFCIGNVFRTEEEAKHEVERRKVLAELKKFSRNFEVHKNKYCIKYDMISKNIDVYNNYGYATGELRFASEKDAKDAIEFVGEDRVVKYYLGVEE